MWCKAPSPDRELGCGLRCGSSVPRPGAFCGREPMSPGGAIFLYCGARYSGLGRLAFETRCHLDARPRRQGCKWTLGTRPFSRSIQLHPRHASAHVWNLMILLKNGQVKEAREELKRATQLDPVSLNSSYDLNWNLLDGRQYEWLIDASKKQLEIDPLFPWSHTTLG